MHGHLNVKSSGKSTNRTTKKQTMEPCTDTNKCNGNRGQKTADWEKSIKEDKVLD